MHVVIVVSTSVSRTPNGILWKYIFGQKEHSAFIGIVVQHFNFLFLLHKLGTHHPLFLYINTLW